MVPMMSIPLWRRVLTLPTVAYWPLWDASGVVCTDLVDPAANVLLDSGFEQEATFSVLGWAPVGGDATNTRVSDPVHSGHYSMRIVTDGPTTGSRLENYTTTVIPGRTYNYSLWTRGDGTYGGRYRIRSSGGDLVSERSTGVTGTEWTEVSGTFTVPAGVTDAIFRLQGPDTIGGTAYFDDVAITCPAGCGAQAGDYNSVTLGAPGIGDGRLAARMGDAGHVDIMTPALQSRFPATEGSLLVWWRYIDPADFVGGEATQQGMFSVYSGTWLGNRDRLTIEKDVEYDTEPEEKVYHTFFYRPGGTPNEEQGQEERFSPDLYWHSSVCTWSEEETKIALWHDGAPAPLAGGGDDIIVPWRDHPIELAQIGAKQGPSSLWHGDMSHVALFSRKLTAPEIRWVSRR